MQFTVATWNINSVRLRIRQVEQFLSRYAPDVLCLQETALQGTAKAIAIARETRSWTRPSDHVPVVAAFDL